MAAPVGSFGLPNQGFVPTDALAALYPYLTFGPQLAAQLANLQFGAGLDVQSQNNQMAQQLAQGLASNRLADTVASRLSLQGFGGTPAAGSALIPGLQGGFGLKPMQAPNLLNLFAGFNQGLGGMFSGGGVQGGTLQGA